MKPNKKFPLLMLVFVLSINARAQESVIRKNLEIRVPLLGKIDEVSKTPIPGVFEVRTGTDVVYTDKAGKFLIQGHLVDTTLKRDLTEERIAKLTAIQFSALPVDDAFTVVRGDGKRKLAVFVDPNCGYCKHFEHELQKVDNVTIHMFLYPVLGADSVDKSHNIWCAKDTARAWNDWMLREQAAPAATCDTGALTRNIEYGKKHGIAATPTLIFAGGTRIPGAVGTKEIEKYFADAK
ncbi:DsbC family protein [Variovorax sp. 770b2]|uniref:DsbC family protein n=1 Tax=Variovorax sp. 770b2 TaxID=1566271 RepID=UPI0015A68664|nr:DsbC family protein [Variovorax sp. 770b2]